MGHSVHNARIQICFAFALAVFTLAGISRHVYAQDSMASGTDAVSTALQEVTEEVIEVAPQYVTQSIPGGDIVMGDFVVGPGKIDVTLKPGETKVVEMTVTNRTGERRRFQVTTEDISGSEDLNTPVKLLGEDRGPYSLKDYLSFSYPSFELDHNQRALVPVTIRIPADAQPGGLYGGVLVNTVALESKVDATETAVPQSAIVARIGTLFFVTVPGDVVREGSFKEFGTLAKQKIFGEGPITFGILFENTGSMHLAPYGEVRVHNMIGEEVGYVELEPWFVLPKSQRLRELSWDREFLMGRYVATANINRSYGDIVDVEEFAFWVLPWKILLPAFAVVFIIIFLIRAFFRTFEFKRKGN